MKRGILKFVLRKWAKALLGKYQPKIIGVTGTVGKTSTKEAIAWVLDQSGVQVGRTYKNLNNEFGVPLSLLGVKSQPKTFWDWMVLPFQFLSLYFGGKFPDFLVLELAIDRLGDMDFFLSLLQPDVAVITALGKTHAEFFDEIGDLWKEKLKLVSALPEEAPVIFNADLADRDLVCSKASRCISFGFEDGDISPEKFQLEGKKTKQLSLTAGFLVARELGLDFEPALEDAKEWSMPKQRLERIDLEDYTVIDDSYNSSPQSAKAALEYLSQFDGRKVAVLGEMRELGSSAKEEHRRLADSVADVDILVTVEDLAHLIGKTAVDKGVIEKRNWHRADDVREVQSTLTEILQKEDTILIKASRAVGLDQLVDWLEERNEDD